jgi:uroporphyrinogen-III synthase
MTKTPLQGLRVMVTRPQPEGEALCRYINAAGGEAVYFPTIQIESLVVSAQHIAALDEQDWLIFISPQAVYASSAVILSHWPVWPASIAVAAVGAGTAHALQARGLPVTVYPDEQWSSEGLLNLPAFLTPAGKKITLIRGEGGRTQLAETLTHRGALVSHLVVYRRHLPIVTVENVSDLVRIDVVICTSGEGLSNLKQLLLPSWEQLQTVPVVVISQRMIELSQALGFQKVYLAKNASHTAIIEMLSQLHLNNGIA